MLQDITLENSPLRIVPATHRSNKLPQQVLADAFEDHSDQVIVTGSAGTIVVMNAHLWHGGMENRSKQPRRVLHAFYCRRDKPQQQYQKRLIDKNLQKTFTTGVRSLFAIDDAENDHISKHATTTSGFMR